MILTSRAVPTLTSPSSQAPQTKNFLSALICIFFCLRFSVIWGPKGPEISFSTYFSLFLRYSTLPLSILSCPGSLTPCPLHRVPALSCILQDSHFVLWVQMFCVYLCMLYTISRRSFASFPWPSKQNVPPF